MKAIAANTLLIEVARQGKGFGLKGTPPVKGRVKTGDMLGLGQVLLRGLQHRQIGRLMQRSEWGKALEAGQDSLIDQAWTGMVGPAMDDAMSDRDDLEVAVAGLKGGPEGMEGRLRIGRSLALGPVLHMIGKARCAKPQARSDAEPLDHPVAQAAMGRCGLKQGDLERRRAAIEGEDGLQGLKPFVTAELQPERPNP